MEQKKINNNKKETGWIIFLIIAFLNLLIIDMLVLAIEPMWGDFNFYLGDLLGSLQINYVFILILIITIPVIYCVILIIYYLFQLIRKGKLAIHIINKIFTVILVVFFDVLLVVLLIIFGEDAAIVGSLFMDNIIYIYMILTTGLIISIPYIYKKFKQFSKSESYNKIKAIIILIPIIVAFITAFILPFILVPANVVDQIPSKPKLIAHRGLAHVAPENTYIAWKLAKENGSYGIEIDVQISIDGKLFLMHDDTLERTTNIQELFPNRINDDASSFNLSDLLKLDAGSWFVDRDPYGAIRKGFVNYSMLYFYKNNVSIPTLEEALNFCRDNNLILDVDFKYPPKTHPFYSQYFNLTLFTINSSGINQSMVWITSGNRTLLDFVKSNYPKMKTGYSVEGSDLPSVQEFLAMGYDLINTHYSISDSVLKSYYLAGIETNIWTVDIQSRFSQLWCLGATYIVSNEPYKFVSQLQPNWTLTNISYIGIWLVIYIFGLVCIGIYVYISEK
ncbi:MAG: glycerophosphodiester phosphodiesterase family protein [Candidatus Helarchaeota archaeon]